MSIKILTVQFLEKHSYVLLFPGRLNFKCLIVVNNVVVVASVDVVLCDVVSPPWLPILNDGWCRW